MVLTDALRPSSLSPAILESVLLIAIAPWLLFPSLAPLITALALATTALIWLWPILSRKKPLPYTPQNGVLLFFCIAVAVGIIVSSDTDATVSKATGFILGITAWRFVIGVVRDRDSLRLVVIAYLLLGIGLITIGLLSADWVVKLPILEPILSLLPSGLILLPEAPTAGVSANQLAGVLVFMLPLFLSLGLPYPSDRSKNRLRIILLLVSVLLSFLLLLTQSRAGWIGGVFGILAVLLLSYLLFRPSRQRRILLIALIVLAFVGSLGLLAIITMSVGDYWSGPTELTVAGAEGNLNFRFEVWKWALVAFEDFPLTGTGLGSFRYVVHRLYPIDISPGYDISHAHNIFLQIGLDLGIIGLIAYLSLLMVSLLTGWNAAKASKDFRPLAIGLVSALIALHVFGMADALALGSKPAVVFWIALGLIVAMQRLSGAEKDENCELTLTVQHSIGESHDA